MNNLGSIFLYISLIGGLWSFVDRIWDVVIFPLLYNFTKVEVELTEIDQRHVADNHRAGKSNRAFLAQILDEQGIEWESMQCAVDLRNNEVRLWVNPYFENQK